VAELPGVLPLLELMLMRDVRRRPCIPDILKRYAIMAELVCGKTEGCCLHTKCQQDAGKYRDYCTGATAFIASKHKQKLSSFVIRPPG
jgi:hypothetical protein